MQKVVFILDTIIYGGSNIWLDLEYMGKKHSR